MATSDQAPASLKPIKPYLQLAEARSAEPLIAYHCRLFALQEAMLLRAKLPKEDMGFVIGLMDQLEKEKATVGDLDDAAVLCETHAQDLFEKADNADRAGQSTLPVAKEFLSSAQLMEVCKQFGDLPADLVEKIKYAKVRFVEICKATKEKRAPAPPRTLDPPADGPSDGAGPANDPLPPPPADTDPPDYFGLPPPPVPGINPPPIIPGPPSFGQLPPAPAGLPAAPTAPAAPPPSAPAAPGLNLMPTPGYHPGPTQIAQALKCSQTVVSSLQFQEVDTAVQMLMRALELLTQPPAR